MLIGSAGDLDGIKKMARQYFYATGEIRILDIDGVLRIAEDGKLKEHFKVTKKGKRFRLETIDGVK